MKTKQMNFRLQEPVVRMLEKVARDYNVTKTTVIENALVLYITEVEKSNGSVVEQDRPCIPYDELLPDIDRADTQTAIHTEAEEIDMDLWVEPQPQPRRTGGFTNEELNEYAESIAEEEARAQRPVK